MSDKVILQNEIDEMPLPEGVSYDTLTGKPTSLADISIKENTTLVAVSGGTPGLIDKSIQGWTFNGVFSATGNASIAWTAGTLRFTDGTTYSIASGSLGSIASLSYVYFNPAVSTTVLQTTTTSANTVGANRLLIAVAQNVASGKSATFQAFGGAGGMGVLLTADNIASNSITANEIQTNTITSLALTSGSITGLTITGGTIQTALASAGKRLRMLGSPANQYQFMDGDTLVGYLKIDDDGAGGYFAQIYIDHLGAVIEVGSTIGAAEITYFNAPFFSGSGRAATGQASISSNGPIAGLTWYGGNAASWSFDLGTSLAEISSHVIPNANNTYDLGSSSLKWKNLYLSGNVAAANLSGTNTGDSSGHSGLAALNDNVTFATVTASYWMQLSKFLYLGNLSGTAAASETALNGAMYYRTDDNVIRVYLNGAWKTITTA